MFAPRTRRGRAINAHTGSTINGTGTDTGTYIGNGTAPVLALILVMARPFIALQALIKGRSRNRNKWVWPIKMAILSGVKSMASVNFDGAFAVRLIG